MSMTETMKGFAAKWAKKTHKQITTVFELLKCYFRDIKVVNMLLSLLFSIRPLKFIGICNSRT